MAIITTTQPYPVLSLRCSAQEEVLDIFWAVILWALIRSSMHQLSTTCTEISFELTEMKGFFGRVQALIFFLPKDGCPDILQIDLNRRFLKALNFFYTFPLVR